MEHVAAVARHILHTIKGLMQPSRWTVPPHPLQPFSLPILGTHPHECGRLALFVTSRDCSSTVGNEPARFFFSCGLSFCVKQDLNQILNNKIYPFAIFKSCCFHSRWLFLSRDSMRRESSSREECSSSALQDEEKTLSLTAKNSIQGTDDGTKTRRTVRFQASPSQVVAHLPTLREMDEDQKRRLWWSMSDYEVFTDTARNISKEVRRHSALTVGLDDAWRKAIQASKNVDQVDDAMQQISLDPVSLIVFQTIHSYPWVSLYWIESCMHLCVHSHIHGWIDKNHHGAVLRVMSWHSFNNHLYIHKYIFVYVYIYIYILTGLSLFSGSCPLVHTWSLTSWPGTMGINVSLLFKE